jgi:hypothetical protein
VHGTIYAAGSHFCKGKVVRAQLRGNGPKFHGISIMNWILREDWIDYRPISRFSVKPRKVGNCIINESR